MMRRVLALSWVALALLFFVPPVGAQDGLQRFERDLKPQIELEKFTYGSARALGDKGFELVNVVAVMPAMPATGDKASTLKIDKVIVEELDFERLTKDNSEDMPRFAKIRFEGMSGDDEMFAMLTPYGVPQVPVDLVIDFRLDGATKVFSLNALEISFRGQARLALALVIDGVSDKASALEGSKDDGRLRTASLTVEDSGLMAKLLPALAKEQGGTADDMIALTLGSIAGFAEDQGPPTLKALDALSSFVRDWKAPKGPLAITLKPAKTAGLSDLDKVMEPNALVDIFGLAVTYPGTRAGAAKSPPGSK